MTIGFILIICLAVSRANDGSSSDNKNSERPSIDNLEIPAKIPDRREQIIRHIGHTVSYKTTTIIEMQLLLCSRTKADENLYPPMQ